MEQLFLKVLNLSLYAGLLILAVLLIRVLFRRAPKWISCLFWALVAIRLLCPVTLESPFSVMPAAEKLPTANFLMTEETTDLTIGQTIDQSMDLSAGMMADTSAEKSAGFVSEAMTADRNPVSLDSDLEESTKADAAIPAFAKGDESTGVSAAANAVADPAGKAHTADPVRILAIIWLAGFCAMLLKAMFSYLRLKRSVAASIKTGRGVRICSTTAG